MIHENIFSFISSEKNIFVLKYFQIQETSFILSFSIIIEIHPYEEIFWRSDKIVADLQLNY